MTRLTKLREKKGLSKNKLATAVGVSHVSIGRYESGKRTMPLDVAAAIAKALGCKVDDLIDKEG